MTGRRSGRVLTTTGNQSVAISSETRALLHLICDHEVRSAAGQVTLLIRREAERLGLSLDGKEPSTDATH